MRFYDWSLIFIYIRGLPKGYSSCQCDNNQIQSSIAYLYFYLQQSSNDEITNKIKANMCLNWYIVVKKNANELKYQHLCQIESQ